jgi:dipeptidyl aminopeptidase/acylaminoacyl peptidase
MRWFVRVLLVIWVKMMILLAVGLVVGHALGGGEMIAYQSRWNGTTNIHLYDVRTGITQPLKGSSGRGQPSRGELDNAYIPAYAWQLDPAWSPDGRRIAFVSQHRGNADIYLLDLRTGSRRNLTNSPDMDLSPVWSPDGRQIAFEAMRDGYWGIKVIDLETGTVRDLTGGFITRQSPTWSPDGRQIAFSSNNGRYWDIYVIDLETGETRNLTNSASDDVNPVWTAASP